ncbi:hypothetical protein ACLWBD_14660 [Bdellovibrio sp. HCB117]|uniref:hypothetical protein n=1 Tax=Bdellovibrio sp. HCB117 TaxID=3394359 RepID=UPI0039B60A6D
MKNEKGFAVILLLACLPVLISGLLLLSSVFGFMQNDLAMKYQCRVHGQQGQKLVAPSLEKLLSLNNTARRLKVEEVAAYAKIAASAGNPPALAAAKARLVKIQNQKRQLDLKQKQLINQANMSLASSFAKTRRELANTQEGLSNILFVANGFHLSGRRPTLAVRPDSSDIAPTYSPVAAFEEKQALAHEWQYTLAVRKPFSQFLEGRFHFKKACAVSLIEENSAWIPKIIKGKFSLKSVW